MNFPTIELDPADDLHPIEGLETLRIGVTLGELDEAIELGPRIVHEVEALTLFRHVERMMFELPDEQLDELDACPRLELTLWDETELKRWPVLVVAIPADLADTLLDGELERLLEELRMVRGRS